jgi:signal transduction histidine kinase
MLRFRTGIVACLCGYLLISASWAVAATDSAEPKRVLMLHSYGRDFKPWSEYARTIRVELERQSPWPLDIQEQTLVTARFADSMPEEPFVEYLAALYGPRPLDLIVSIGAPAAGFVQRRRDRLFRKVPMLLTAVEQRRVDYLRLTGNDTVVSVRSDISGFLGGILQVLPDVRTIAVVTGASPLERYWLTEIKKAAAPLEYRVNFVWYAELPFEEMLRRASTLPPNSAIFWHLLSIDAAGVPREGDAALRELHSVANAPIFSYQEAFFGDGIVGGPMHSVARGSEKAAATAIRLLGGEKPGAIEPVTIDFAVPRFDWREMRRWGISEDRLPSGSQIDFRSPTLFDKYRWQIAMILGVVLLQSGLIAALLHERRGRHLAEIQSRQRLAELAHMNRYSVSGELTTSIAHELNQPLGAILTNAETAELMLKSTSPNIAELREILSDIRRDDQRASDLIRHLRGMLKRAPFDPRDIDLNATISEVVNFVSPLAQAADVKLNCRLAPQELRINGDPVQVQQVVLNLIMNSIDAVSQIENLPRKIEVETGPAGGCAEISIADSGPGIASDQLKAVFEPFFTTKAKGMGMGLSIARTIVEAHHGRILAENKVDGGARFLIRLPCTRQDLPAV